VALDHVGPDTVVNPILCVGYHPNDVAQLLTIARQLQERTGIPAVFSTVAPKEVASRWEGHYC